MELRRAPEHYLPGLRRLFLAAPRPTTNEELDAFDTPVRSQRAIEEEFDPATAIFTDGTNLFYFLVPYIELGCDLSFIE